MPFRYIRNKIKMVFSRTSDCYNRNLRKNNIDEDDWFHGYLLFIINKLSKVSRGDRSGHLILKRTSETCSKTF